MAAERLAEKSGIALKKSGHQGIYGVGRVAGEEAAILLPQTFMNLSGVSVGSAVHSFGVSPGDLIVLHDEIEIPFGTLKVKVGGGHGGHNGIRNIRDVLGWGDFVRIRIGVGRPTSGREVSDHVLSPFSREENHKLDTVLANTVLAVETVLSSGIQKAMNDFNNRDISN
jgi:PTH1 family peptidyl-tRNA hydrolase